jgi:hypothetical protein
MPCYNKLACLQVWNTSSLVQMLIRVERYTTLWVVIPNLTMKTNGIFNRDALKAKKKKI